MFFRKIQVYYLLQKNEGNSNNKNRRGDSVDSFFFFFFFLQHANANFLFLHFGWLKGLFLFHNLNYFLK